MIKITFIPDEHKLTFKGHAEGYDDITNAIICSSVSTVFYNLCAMLREYPSEAFSIPFAMKEAKNRNGISYVKAVPSEAYAGWIHHDIYYAMVGLETIQGNYPNAIELAVKQK
jgi:uncharacterized protein YsxB (DUF464 family)